MKHSSLTCAEARQIDLVNYLANFGHQPQKILGNDYWYRSPLRQEKHASFKVNRKKNIWYDFGTGAGGTIIDFGIRYHHCSISQFLKQLKPSFSFHQPIHSPEPEAAGQKKKTRVIAVTPITNPALCRYLQDREIPLELAEKYCREVHFSVGDRPYFAIGFANNSGGYELRSSRYKGCIAPKDITILPGKEKVKEMAVFEGFFSFLSYLQFKKIQAAELPKLQARFLVLNSLSLFKKSREIMEKHQLVHLFLDLDPAGGKATAIALQWNKCYRDERSFYQGYKDFNDMLIRRKINNRQSRNLRQKMF